MGMHLYTPPSICEKCGTKEVPTWHHYCIECAESLGKCPHCGGKRPPPEPESKADVPAASAPPPEAPQAPDSKIGELKGDKLLFNSITPTRLDPPEHPLFSFVCVEKDFEGLFAEYFRKEGPGEPPLLKSTDELVLYTTWGRRLATPVPAAVLDRKARQVGVTVTWKGPGMMRDARSAPYAGWGFKLGRLEPGEYSVGIWEATPVDKDGPKLTKTLKFRVVR